MLHSSEALGFFDADEPPERFRVYFPPGESVEDFLDAFPTVKREEVITVIGNDQRPIEDGGRLEHFNV